MIYRFMLKILAIKKDDKCFVAEIDNKIVGAVWVRIMNDYGNIDDTTQVICSAFSGLVIYSMDLTSVTRIGCTPVVATVYSFPP